MLALCLAFAGCVKKKTENYFDDVILREDYRSVYNKIGKDITVDMVEEVDGRAYVTLEGVRYELGMDFLSMAMVYNVRPAGSFDTAEKAYNEWWRLFMRRWNRLAPEVPLYSNQYYDIYNAKIDELKTTPYWKVTDAIVGARVKTGDNAVILGSNTELSGAFRNAGFGKSAANSADLSIEELTSGYSTVVTDEAGSFVWAGTDIVASHDEKTNDDGTKTFTVRIADNLTFSDGSPITAENYLVYVLAGSTAVYKSAGGGDNAGFAFVGHDAFAGYTGEGANVPFAGVRLLDNYSFSVTVAPRYADYYYAVSYGAFTPVPTSLYLGKYRIKDDGAGAYIEKGFYDKTQKNGVTSYTMSETITKNLSELSEKAFPYSGPYVLERYDEATKTATLKRNTRYKGDVRGKASIDKISFIRIVSETQLDQLKQGRVDVLASVTGGEETKASLALVDGVRFKETHYDRAGYGKLAFRCDFSPTQFASVRRAVMHTIDRNEFAQTFTGGYGSVVDAPYYTGSPAYIANKDKLGLNKYPYSLEKARTELRDGGWVYNADGSAYEEGSNKIRYKKLEGYELSYNNLGFASTDGKYKTVKVNGAYYMPLAINWMGTQPNPVTDQLITSWQTNPNAGERIGAYITYTSGDMNGALYGEYSQMPAYGFTKARYGAVNFATGYTSAAYDQSFSWTIDQNMYANYSSNYLMDEADFLSNYE